jgi:hypothetical protein
MKPFESTRRQHFIDAESYRNTLDHYKTEIPLYQENLARPETYPGDHAYFIRMRAMDHWVSLQLRYTGGEPISELAPLLDGIVSAYGEYVEKTHDATDEYYRPPFLLSEFFDQYTEYLHIVCVALLMHREDLLPIILAWNEGTDFDGVDAVIEELFKFYFPDRPDLDAWLWDKPYKPLLDTIDEPDPRERPSLMEKFVKSWYPSMKGIAGFWGKHEEIKPDFSPYSGYWNMCAAAFTYLYDIDDSSYRDEITYPKDLVDYARSMPRRPVSCENGEQILRVLGNQPCPREGFWFSPAHLDSLKLFKAGELMPALDSEYGATIWQWNRDE